MATVSISISISCGFFFFPCKCKEPVRPIQLPWKQPFISFSYSPIYGGTRWRIKLCLTVETVGGKMIERMMVMMTMMGRSWSHEFSKQIFFFKEKKKYFLRELHSHCTPAVLALCPAWLFARLCVCDAAQAAACPCMHVPVGTKQHMRVSSAVS